MVWPPMARTNFKSKNSFNRKRLDLQSCVRAVYSRLSNLRITYGHNLGHLSEYMKTRIPMIRNVWHQNPCLTSELAIWAQHEIVYMPCFEFFNIEMDLILTTHSKFSYFRIYFPSEIQEVTGKIKFELPSVTSTPRLLNSKLSF